MIFAITWCHKYFASKLDVSPLIYPLFRLLLMHIVAQMTARSGCQHTERLKYLLDIVLQRIQGPGTK